MKALLLIISSVVAALAIAGAAGAGGNGATVVDISSCTPTPFGPSCADIDTVTNVTETPSGNTSYVTNGTIAMTSANPFCTTAQSQVIHEHYLEKKGEQHSLSERTSSTSSIECFGGTFTLTCVTSFQRHYANGDFQFDRPDVVCTTS